MLKLYQATYRPSRSLAEQTNALKLTALSRRLASGQFHLLAGRNDNPLIRVLCLPRNGPPAIKCLRVTLNQILAKLKEAASLSREFGELSEEESSVSDLVEAVMSADEDAHGHSLQNECE